MKKLLCWLGIVWLGCLGVRADDIVIDAFDVDGNLTFNTIPNAQSYRIEWATGAGSAWTNFQAAAEALDNIPATSDPAITVEVPVRYRVVGSVTNPPPPEYLVIDISGGPSATNYPVSYRADAPPLGGLQKAGNLVLRRIPAGTFVMGSPVDEVDCCREDETQHTVTLTQDFYIGVFPVTQRQWERVMGTWPSASTNASLTDHNPVERVSYRLIRENPSGMSPNWPQSSQVGPDSFMGRLRARTGLDFDLPTEAQWEYACRAGTTTALNSGENLTREECDGEMDAVGWYWCLMTEFYDYYTTEPVGHFQPNAWGLYDMHGNVQEWCLDWYGSYPEGPVTDPVGATSGSSRVLRGGSYLHFALFCRSASREKGTPQGQYITSGFRVAVPAH